MQKSCKALLQRRAVAASLERKGTCGKRIIYKVSLPLVLFLSGLVFLLNFLSSHGNGLKDELKVEHGDSNRHETQITSIKSSIDHIETNLGEELKETLQFTPQESTHLLERKPLNNEDLVNEAYVSSSHTSEEKHNSKETISSVINQEKEANNVKIGKLSHAVPSLDEFKNRASAAKEKKLSSQTDIVIHRLEPGGKEYNYASAKKGAKVLNSNKEAKGAPNILDKDEDKYLRNPCSAEEKFVTIELSEETLVDTIEIGNFEHYSSNFKDFELYSSLSYPTDSWVKLGTFMAQNVKHKHKFFLSEPKWARYLKLNLLNHYGSEFYCTLSAVEVFGVDAVERMLEDLMSAESKNSKQVPHQEGISKRVTQVEASNEDHHRHQEFVEKVTEDFTHECPKPSVSNAVSDSRPMQIGRMPGDAILKILLQKVQFLDLSFSVLEKYLEELNGRYTRIFKDFDDDMSDKVLMLEKMESELKILHSSKDTCAKETEELQAWKSAVSSQLEQLSQDNINLRSEFKKVRDDQADMENRSLAVIYVSSMFGALAAAKMCSGMFLNAFGTHKSAWFFLLLSSCLVTFILMI